MNFENSFTVDVPTADVWQAMMDFERVAPCMPGAEVTERTGEDAYKVQVRVKVGPMSMTYRGQAEITDRDDDSRAAAMRVQARETRGQGSANATVQINLAEEGAGTRATMTTDLKLSGRAAAMGRGVITDVSQALVSEFAANLARMLSEGAGGGMEDAAPSGPVAAPGPAVGGSAAPAGPAVSGSPASAPESPPPGPEPPPPPGPEPPPPPGPPPSGTPPGPPPSAPPPSSTDALDAAALARTVVNSRLRDPKSVLAGGGVVALVCMVIGFRLGRHAARR